jgi:membrane-bound lytic murein transglycosylase D
MTLRRAALATIIAGTCLQACAPTALKPESQSSVSAESTRIPGVPRAATSSAIAVDSRVLATPHSVDPAIPEVYFADVYERIRAGFQLGDAQQRAVDVQVSWYTRHPDYLERTFTRGQLYLHYIVEQLEARNMPLELALLPLVESAFEPFGYSHARAAGLWQFIAPTGTRFGLKQNFWYDGRRDVIESTRAALDYLQFLHNEFNGDWLLAVAAYNCGEVAVQRAVRKNLEAGKPTDFWHLRLPRETRAYVPKLLAMRRIVNEPETYGLELFDIPNEPYFITVDTGGQIDLRLAAELAGLTQDELWQLNPAFHRWATDPEGPHHLLLPVEAAPTFAELLAQVPVEERVRVTRYAVQPGDTLSSVARHHHTSINVLKQLNKLTASTLHPGQELILPGAGVPLPTKVSLAAARVDGRPAPGSRAYHIVRRGETLSSIARKHGVTIRSLARWNGMKSTDMLRAGRKLVLRASVAQADVETEGDKTTYTVRRGDTLSEIARRFRVSVTQLVSWNGLSRRGIIRPGQRLVILRG